MTYKCATLFMTLATAVAAADSSQARGIIKVRDASNSKAQQAFAKRYKKGRVPERTNTDDMTWSPGIV